jgi:uncharacterized membrane protein YkoI
LFKQRSEVVAHRENMKATNALFAATICLLALAVSAPAQAGKAMPWANGAAFSQSSGQMSGRGLMPGPVSQNGRMSLMQIANTLVPLGQVLEAINAQEPGSQLDTNTVIENGKPIYVVRWQASRGRIIIFRVDAETGQIIGRQS